MVATVISQMSASLLSGLKGDVLPVKKDLRRSWILKLADSVNDHIDDNLEPTQGFSCPLTWRGVRRSI